jgi:hypothetical protein
MVSIITASVVHEENAKRNGNNRTPFLFKGNLTSFGIILEVLPNFLSQLEVWVPMSRC